MGAVHVSASVRCSEEEQHIPWSSGCKRFEADICGHRKSSSLEEQQMLYTAKCSLLALKFRIV